MASTPKPVSRTVPFSWAVITARDTAPVGYASYQEESSDYNPATQVSRSNIDRADKSWCERESTGDFLIGKDKDTKVDD